MSPVTSYVRNPQIVATPMDGELVMIDVDGGQYFGVAGVGVRLWQLLESPRTEADLVSIVQAEYEVAPDVAEEDVRAFLRALLDAALLNSA